MAIGLVKSGKLLTGGRLAEAERRLGVELPGDYRGFLLARNGGEPHPPVTFPYRQSDGEEEVAEVTLFFSVEGKGDNDLEKLTEYFRSELGVPDHLLPVAETDDEDILLLALSGDGRDKVYDWYLIEGGYDEDHVLPVADSFGGFLEQLRPILRGEV